MSTVLIRLHCNLRARERARRNAMRKPFLLSLALALLIGGMFVQPQCVRADDYVPGTTLYLVDNQGASDVTFTYSPQDGTVISMTGAVVPVTLDYMSGHMYDLNGNLIGFIF